MTTKKIRAPMAQKRQVKNQKRAFKAKKRKAQAKQSNAKATSNFFQTQKQKTWDKQTVAAPQKIRRTSELAFPFL